MGAMTRVVLLLQYFLFMLGIIADVAIASSNVLHPHCVDKCGDVSIPYPFGIGAGCFREGFELICIDKEDFLGPLSYDADYLRPVNISLSQGEVRMYSYLSYVCYRESDTPVYMRGLFDFRRGPFQVSATRNTFVAIGCDTLAYIQGFNKPYLISGCSSTCNNLDSVDKNGSCTGSGCCQTLILENLVSYRMGIYPNSDNRSAVLKFSPCSYAFMVEKNWFNFNYTYLQQGTIEKYWSKLPLVLDWVAGRENCQEAQKNHSSYACQSNKSECYEPTNMNGYRCNCSEGYEGNPYLLDGCQDIDECQPHNPCEGKCINREGGYNCSCPPGKHSDVGPRSNKCVPDPDNSLPLWVKAALGVSCGAVSLAILSLVMCVESQKRKLSKEKQRFFKQNGGLILYEEIKSTGSNAFQIFRKEELEKATNMFDNNVILGHGGHGTVYMGRLEGDVSVAIKKSRVIDESQKKEFVKEILILSQINHRNVVKILGCCLEVEVPMLVYEYVSNGTLFDYIHGKNQENPIPFDTRLRIAAESAEALAYLHSSASPPILHGDVKSSNILLDENYLAKVSDFGASTLVAMDEIQLATILQGTCGYLDPEYMQKYIFTEKSDVYSFGVVLLELLTRKKAFYVEGLKEKNLATIFLSLMKENRLFEFLDDQLMNEGYIELLHEVSELVRQCLNFKGEERPTMKEVTEGLQALRKLAQCPWEQLPSEECQSLLGESPTYDIVADATRFYSFETRSVLNIDRSRVST